MGIIYCNNCDKLIDLDSDVEHETECRSCSYCGFELETEIEKERGLCNECYENELLGNEYGGV
jgi:hypothetical protein